MADYCRTTIFFKGPEPDEREIRALIDSYTTINQDGIAITDFSELTGVGLHLNWGWRRDSPQLWEGDTKWEAPIHFVLALSEIYPDSLFFLRFKLDGFSRLRTTTIFNGRVIHEICGYYESSTNPLMPHSHHRLGLTLEDEDWGTFLIAAAEDGIAKMDEYDLTTTRSEAEIRQWFRATLPEMQFDINAFVPFTVCDDTYLSALYRHALSDHDEAELDSAPPLGGHVRRCMSDLEREIELSIDEQVRVAGNHFDRLCDGIELPKHLVLRLVMLRSSIGNDEFDRRCRGRMHELVRRGVWIERWLSCPTEASEAANYGGPFHPTQSELLSLLASSTAERRSEMVNGIRSPRWEGRWLVEEFDSDQSEYLPWPEDEDEHEGDDEEFLRHLDEVYAYMQLSDPEPEPEPEPVRMWATHDWKKEGF